MPPPYFAMMESTSTRRGVGGTACSSRRSIQSSKDFRSIMMAPAVAEVNENRPVMSRGWKTPLAVDTDTPKWYSAVDRWDFYKAACRAIKLAVQGCRNDRERRKAEREAILQTLENLALIERTRGGVPITPKERKPFPA